MFVFFKYFFNFFLVKIIISFLLVLILIFNFVCFLLLMVSFKIIKSFIKVSLLIVIGLKFFFLKSFLFNFYVVCGIIGFKICNNIK